MTYSVQIKVMPLKELLDPQGKAVMGGLQNLGLTSMNDVRIGKNINLQIEADNPDQAKEIAARLNIPTVYGSYEELLNDASIDAVYIPLPNHMHVEWAIRSLQANKHVLCEKPVGLTSAEAQQLAVFVDLA